MPKLRDTLGVLAVLILAVTGWPAPSSATPGHVGSAALRSEATCFTVHPDGDALPRRVFGTRYHLDGSVAPRPTLLLVHGASTSKVWDIREDFSVARSLAGAGYPVVLYDQLAFGDSPYDAPNGHRRLILQGHRAMVHEVVGQLKAGGYGLDGNCDADDGGATAPPAAGVVLVGHSGGGAIVSGYPGRYGDVDGIVQVGWSNHGFNPEFFTPDHGGWNWGRQFATGSDWLYFMLDDRGRFSRDVCEPFTMFVDGVEPDIRHEFCGEPTIRTIGGPSGWLPSLGTIAAENRSLIGRTGKDFPVLLAWADSDSIFRSEDAAAEDAYWRDNCGCRVTVFTQERAGHALQAHRSMPTFVEAVLTWLEDQHPRS